MAQFVPMDGLQIWPEPDPSLVPIGVLEPGREVSLAETRGQWARVEVGAGLEGWVDAGRLLDDPPDLQFSDGGEDEEPALVGPHPRVLQPFPTENPYLLKLFQIRYFGDVSFKAVELLERASPDLDELLIFATRTAHGRWKRGYLLLTTNMVRWVQTLPSYHEDSFPFGYKFDYQRIGALRGLLIGPGGEQFQLSAAKAKGFREMFNLASLAHDWEAANQPVPVVPVVPESGGPTPDLTAQLRELAVLRDQGVLTEAEFDAAKQRLLS